MAPYLMGILMFAAGLFVGWCGNENFRTWEREQAERKARRP